jgi:hypothetical protein
LRRQWKPAIELNWLLQIPPRGMVVGIGVRRSISIKWRHDGHGMLPSYDDLSDGLRDNRSKNDACAGYHAD